MKPELARAGYDMVAPQNPSVAPIDSPAPPQSSMYPDVEQATGAILGLMDQGKDVIVVCHSYAGTVGGEATGRVVAYEKARAMLPSVEGGSAKARGKLLWVVYVSAYVTLEQTSNWDCADLIYKNMGIVKPDGPLCDWFPFWSEKVRSHSSMTQARRSADSIHLRGIGWSSRAQREGLATDDVRDVGIRSDSLP